MRYGRIGKVREEMKVFSYCFRLCGFCLCQERNQSGSFMFIPYRRGRLNGEPLS